MKLKIFLLSFSVYAIALSSCLPILIERAARWPNNLQNPLEFEIKKTIFPENILRKPFKEENVVFTDSTLFIESRDLESLFEESIVLKNMCEDFISLEGPLYLPICKQDFFNLKQSNPEYYSRYTIAKLFSLLNTANILELCKNKEKPECLVDIISDHIARKLCSHHLLAKKYYAAYQPNIASRIIGSFVPSFSEKKRVLNKDLEKIIALKILEILKKNCIKLQHEVRPIMVKEALYGQYLISISVDKTLKIWNTKTWRCCGTLSATQRDNTVNFLDDDDDTSIIILDWKDTTEIGYTGKTQHRTTIKRCQNLFNQPISEGKYIISLSDDGKSLEIYSNSCYFAALKVWQEKESLLAVLKILAKDLPIKTSC